MTRRNLFGLPLALATLYLAPLLPANAQPKPMKPIQIGMIDSFFNDVPDELAKLVIAPFGEVMEKTTGLKGGLVLSKGTFQTARMLNDGDFDLAVFHGHEFAWAQKKYPTLKPLMIVVNEHHDVRAHIVVKKDSPAKKLGDLRKKVLSLPVMSKEHCRVYLDQNFTDNATPDIKKFFNAVNRSVSPYAGLDDVAAGKVDAVVVDTIALETYKKECLPRYRHLRVLADRQFPAPVIAYKEGAINAVVLKTVREGLLKASESATAREMLAEWQIKGFELVPTGYSDTLAETLRAYPMPESTKMSKR